MSKGIQHLKQFSLFKNLIENYSISMFEKQVSVFHELVAAIVYQQISVAAADNIHKRFLIKMGGNIYSVDELIEVSEEEMQECGLSKQKRGYMKNIAHFFKEHDLEIMNWDDLSDEEIIELLTKIKGVGEWTVQMLLLFFLERQDVFPVKDLGVQIAMKGIFKLDLEKKILEKKMIEISEPWKPYRSLATKYLWAWKRAH